MYQYIDKSHDGQLKQVRRTTSSGSGPSSTTRVVKAGLPRAGSSLCVDHRAHEGVQNEVSSLASPHSMVFILLC